MKIPFSKYSGSGNDFILIDNRNAIFPKSQALIERLCKRRTGVGADGIILLEPSTRADFKMRIFNADGGEAEMCGNGMRCLLKFILASGFTKPEYLIETMHASVTLSHNNGTPCVAMPPPTRLQVDLKLTVQHKELTTHFIDTGVPHCILQVEDLEKEHWMAMAPHIRHHPHFAPQGANVNFIKLDSQGKLHIRTYERGVEDETLACGTGATAAALIASLIYRLLPPIQVIPRSKETLVINFAKGFSNVTLSGPAVLIFQGELILT